MEFAGQPGQHLYVAIVSSSVTGGCGMVNLLAPDGSTLVIGCVDDNGVGDLDQVLTSDGTYAIVFSPGAGQTGQMQVQLTFSTDIQGTLPADGSPSTVTIAQPGQAGYLTFAGTVGERVLIDATDSTLPDDCTTVSLRDPNGGTMEFGCLSRGQGYVDGILLPATGLYTVAVNPSDANTGQVTLRLLRSRDTHGSIVIGGPPVTVRVSVPGQVAYLAFNAQAGDRVAVSLTSTTMPAQCGASLLAPDNSTIALGCVASPGAGGIDPTSLAVGGTYTIVVNPDGLTTGAVTVTVVRPAS
jgi:hypothetical protein